MRPTILFNSLLVEVENRVGNLRGQTRLAEARVTSLPASDAWLEDQRAAYATRIRHSDYRDRTIREVFEDERASPMKLRGPYDGFVEKAVRASATCLIIADHNRYSVDSPAACRMVPARSHAERVAPNPFSFLVRETPADLRAATPLLQCPWHPRDHAAICLRSSARTASMIETRVA